MTKLELTHALKTKTGLPLTAINDVLNSLASVAEKELRQGQDFPLPGIGKLCVVHSGARKGRNPQTGEEITIPAGKKVKFAPYKSLKEAVN